jgi:putative oxidoreductase
MRLLNRFTEPAFLLLRVIAALMFGFHGAQKTFGVLSDFHPALSSQIGVGGVIELSTGLLMALGLWTRCAALLASGTMAVAYLQFHWKLALGREFFPGINKGELALLYSILFLYIACRGPGPYSLDARLRGEGRAP